MNQDQAIWPLRSYILRKKHGHKYPWHITGPISRRKTQMPVQCKDFNKFIQAGYLIFKLKDTFSFVLLWVTFCFPFLGGKKRLNRKNFPPLLVFLVINLSLEIISQMELFWLPVCLSSSLFFPPLTISCVWKEQGSFSARNVFLSLLNLVLSSGFSDLQSRLCPRWPHSLASLCGEWGLWVFLSFWRLVYLDSLGQLGSAVPSNSAGRSSSQQFQVPCTPTPRRIEKLTPDFRVMQTWNF